MARAGGGLRPVRVGVLVLLLAGLTAAVVFRSSVAAQAQAMVVLATVLEAPVLRHAFEAVTDDPRLVDSRVAGVPTTIALPRGEGPWPTVVFVNGATPLGRDHPDVRRLAAGLARTGFLVLVPDLPGLRRGAITGRTADATIAVARAAAGRDDTRGGRVAFLGVSVGASLALVAAAHPSLVGRVSVVGGLAPYADLAEVTRLATTGVYRTGRGFVRYESDPFVALAIGRSLVAALPPGRDRTALVARLAPVDDEAPDPLAVLRDASPASPAAAAVVDLLRNRRPGRFDRLYARLPPALRSGVRRLSPVFTAGRLRARVELASAPRDKYFPLAESRLLVARAPHARLTVTETLEHAIPDASLGGLAGLFRLDAFAVRVLRAARR